MNCDISETYGSIQVNGTLRIGVRDAFNLETGKGGGTCGNNSEAAGDTEDQLTKAALRFQSAITGQGRHTAEINGVFAKADRDISVRQRIQQYVLSVAAESGFITE